MALNYAPLRELWRHATSQSDIISPRGGDNLKSWGLDHLMNRRNWVWTVWCARPGVLEHGKTLRSGIWRSWLLIASPQHHDLDESLMGFWGPGLTFRCTLGKMAQYFADTLLLTEGTSFLRWVHAGTDSSLCRSSFRLLTPNRFSHYRNEQR